MGRFNRLRERLRAALPPSLWFWLRFHREKLVAKRRLVLKPDHFEQDPAPPTKAVISRRGLQVIVFDDGVPAPDRDAGGARMFLILKSLVKLGQPVFISLSNPQQAEYERLAQEGVEIAHWIDYKRLLKERGFHVALLSRPDVTGALLPSIKRAAPGIKTVFDTVDVAFVRLEREHGLNGDEKVALAARRSKKLEVRLARACDQVWCVTTEDQAALAQEAPAARFEIIPTIHPLQDRGQGFAARQGLLFIGNFLHRPNGDAIHYFMREIYPFVREAIPDLKLFIVGDNAPPDIVAYNSDEVTVPGHVANVDPIFHNSRVFIAPLRFGAGIKGKIGQALSYGLPVVTTSRGAEGYQIKRGEHALIADTPKGFARDVIRVYRDRELWQRLSDQGYRLIQMNFTPEVIEPRIREAIAALNVT